MCGDEQDFSARRSNQKWLSDVTEFDLDVELAGQRC